MDFSKLPEQRQSTPGRRRRRRLVWALSLLALIGAGVWWWQREEGAAAGGRGAPRKQAAEPPAREAPAALNADDIGRDLEAKLSQAREIGATGRHEEAAKLLAEARDLQRALNERFGQSRFASAERLQQIEAERQTQLAVASRREVAELEARLSGHLRRRELFQAQVVVREAVTLLEAAMARHPKAANFDEPLRLRLNYLMTRSADLPQTQDETYDLLLPLPGRRDARMTRTEITQTLYTRVMSVNPSRHVAPARPVDSVRHADAQEFCRRLGWILGARVRLPTEAEYRAALGASPGELISAAWCAENSPGQTQPAGKKAPNAAGFYDLLGNVAEWLQDEDAVADRALLAGGSYATPAAELQKVSVGRAPKAERARTNGFRVVVEMKLDE